MRTLNLTCFPHKALCSTSPSKSTARMEILLGNEITTGYPATWPQSTLALLLQYGNGLAGPGQTVSTLAGSQQAHHSNCAFSFPNRRARMPLVILGGKCESFIIRFLFLRPSLPSLFSFVMFDLVLPVLVRCRNTIGHLQMVCLM